jgi:hypothetical protein
MSHGIDAISVPAAKAQEFNEKMVRFYLSKDATEMMAFLMGLSRVGSTCSPLEPPTTMLRGWFLTFTDCG